MAVIEYDADGKPHNESGKRIADTISVRQLFRMFPDEDVCHAWLEETRWRGTPVCPHCCGVENIRKLGPSQARSYWHKDCRRYFTVRTGTSMHATKRPLQDWIYTIYTVVTARKGVNAMQFPKELGVQYHTAWHLAHRVREACGRGDFALTNVVVVDETYIGGKEANKHESKKLKQGRGTVGKTAVVGVLERDPKVKAQPVERTNAVTLIPFVEANVEQGAAVYTDDAAAYGASPSVLNQFTHETVAHSKGESGRGAAHTNGIEAVWAVLKRSIHGTWHHFPPKHLARYVKEASFRLNEGNCEIDTLDRMRDFARGIHGKRLRYVDLIAPTGESATPVAVQ